MTDREYPYPDERDRTHWTGCWRAPKHHNCAVAKVYELQEELSRIAQRFVTDARPSEAEISEYKEWVRNNYPDQYVDADALNRPKRFSGESQ